MPDIGYQATTTALTLNNALGFLVTLWQKAAEGSTDFQQAVQALGHDGLVAKGFDDSAHNPGAPNGYDPGTKVGCPAGAALYAADVLKTAADIWQGTVGQAGPFSFSNATANCRAPRPGG